MNHPHFPNFLIAEASRAISRYAAHQRVLEAMALRLPLTQTLTRLAISIEDAAPGSLCAIMLLDETGTKLATGASPNIPDSYNQLINGVSIGPSVGSCGTAIFRKARVIVSDIENDPLWADYKGVALPHNLRACWSTPIIDADGSVLGSFALYYPTVRHPTDSEISLVDDAVDLACVAIGQARAELSMRISETHYRAVVETAPSAIVGLQRNGIITEWNRAAEHLFGRSRASVIGMHFSSTCLTSDARATFDLCFDASLRQNSHASCETEIRHIDGTTRWAMWSMSALSNDGERGGVLAIAQDITARMEAEEALRRSEQQLRHSQKMEAVGRLAGGIAHDFNNLLTVIHGNTSLALLDAEKGSGVHAALEEVREASTRASSLTRQLLAFSRRESVELQLLDVNAVVSDLRRMLVRLIGEHIQLETDLHEENLVVRADRTNIEQLLINLVVNARDAMHDGGVVTIECARVVLDDEAAAELELLSGPYVQLAVADTGAGMDEETRARAFEPFFTTKPSGEGTGLGLATVYAIATRHEGAVDIESRPGVGTTVTLWLPLVAEEATSAETTGEHQAQSVGTGTVLLVEDEEAVRNLARRVLVAHGFRVLEASNGEDALQVWAQHGSSVDVLVTDVVMPKMGGQALVDRLRTERPDLAVVFCSGYSDNMLLPLSDDDARTSFLAKPFTLHGLVERVTRLCNSSARPTSGSHPSVRSEPRLT
ncbi:MAG: PAS domain S-box protein [Gemmatimonas sp.]